MVHEVGQCEHGLHEAEEDACQVWMADRGAARNGHMQWQLKVAWKASGCMQVSYLEWAACLQQET